MGTPEQNAAQDLATQQAKALGVGVRMDIFASYIGFEPDANVEEGTVTLNLLNVPNTITIEHENGNRITGEPADVLNHGHLMPGWRLVQ